LNGEITGPSEIVGIFSNEAAITLLNGATDISFEDDIGSKGAMSLLIERQSTVRLWRL